MLTFPLLDIFFCKNFPGNFCFSYLRLINVVLNPREKYLNGNSDCISSGSNLLKIVIERDFFYILLTTTWPQIGQVSYI